MDPKAGTLNLGLLILRVGYGAFMLFGHGLGKLMSFNEIAEKFADPLGVGAKFSLALAVFSEVFCSILLILGLGTRVAAFFLMFTMTIAAFVVHKDDPWSTQEKAQLYLLVYAALMATGPGDWSLDRLIFGGKSKAE